MYTLCGNLYYFEEKRALIYKFCFTINILSILNPEVVNWCRVIVVLNKRYFLQ